MRQHKRLLLVVLVIGGITVLYWLGFGRYLSLAFVKASQADFEVFRASRPWLAAILFFLAYAAATALSFPGAAVMTLAAGAIFGVAWGTLIVSFASSVGATVAFLASRWLLASWIEPRFGDRMAALNEGMAKDGGFYLFTLRLLPIFPFFVINLAMGLTVIRTWTFYWVSQLGMLAGTLVYVNAGTQLAQIDSLAGIVSPKLLASFVLLGLFPLAARKAVAIVQARRSSQRWTRPRRFDRNLVVIGAGSGGLVAAYVAAAVRAKVTLIEQHQMGGDCLNTGCVPSKALIRSAKFIAQVKRAKAFGARSAQVEFSFSDVMDRVRRVVTQIEPHDSVARYERLGVNVATGTARIVSPWEVQVTHRDGSVRRLTTRNIVIATGARPTIPPIPGLSDVGYLTSDTVWNLTALPRRMVVLGGGPIGCELAQSFARLGAQVTVVEMAPRVLAREDPEVSAAVAHSLLRDGIALVTGHQVIRCEKVEGARRIVVSRDDREVSIEFDALLVAVGRSPRVEGFGLEELGISLTEQRSIQTDAYLQTLHPNIYAVGNVVGPLQFTHVAAHQAWHAAVNALFGRFRRFKVDYRVVPRTTFTDPEVARVGLSETEAKQRNIPFEVTRYNLDDMDRAIADEVAHGFIKVLTVPGKDRILGVTIMGEHAGELIAEYVIAMKHRLGLNKILSTIHAYPTMSEANKYVAGEWRRAHAPQKLLSWVERYHEWQLS